jgi:hypothetical protein
MARLTVLTGMVLVAVSALMFSFVFLFLTSVRGGDIELWGPLFFCSALSLVTSAFGIYNFKKLYSWSLVMILIVAIALLGPGYWGCLVMITIAKNPP